MYSSRGLTRYEENISGGTQYTWLKGDEVYISACLYDSKSKIMIQPGNRNESKLLEWICDFHQMDQASRGPGNTDQVPAPNLSHTIPPTSSVDNNKSASSEHQESVPVPELYVKLPPLHADDTSSTKKDISDTETVQRKYVLNELLCFVQNKMDSGMPQDMVIEVCTQFYTDENIGKAKEVLFDNVPAKIRFRQRKGAGKGKADMADICRVLLEAEVQDTPLFTAHVLANLPAMSVDCMDSLKLRSDIEDIKQQMKLITSNQKDLVSTLQQKCVADKSEPTRSEEVIDVEEEHITVDVEEADDVESHISTSD